MNKKFTQIGIVIPVFNESEGILLLLDEIQQILKPLRNYKFCIIVVDDGSTDDTKEALHKFSPQYPNMLYNPISLKYNVGHQRAIYQGLLYSKSLKLDYVVVMDGDGEDDPKALPELLSCSNYDIVHVVRGKRKESIPFKIFYSIYKILFYLITGKKMNFGNYCLINHYVLNIVTENPFVHFAANISKLKVLSNTITYDRRKRIHGNSKMNFNSLAHHGFRSLVEYAEEVLMMIFKIFVLSSISILTVGAIVMYKKFVSGEAILGWASTILMGLLNAAILSIGFFIIGVFLLNLSFKRDQQANKVLYNELNSEKDI